MQHITIDADRATALAEGVKAFEGDRTDAAFQAFAAAARTRASDYALGIRLERGDQAGVRVVGYWEEPAFLRRVTVERDLGMMEAGLADEILVGRPSDAPIEARIAGLDLNESGEPVNLFINLMAAG